MLYGFSFGYGVHQVLLVCSDVLTKHRVLMLELAYQAVELVVAILSFFLLSYELCVVGRRFYQGPLELLLRGYQLCVYLAAGLLQG